MKYRPLIGDAMSGSIGGVTASHNRGGTYFRQRATPVNPNSPQQQAVRGFVAALTSAWGDTLTQVQRDQWTTYAANVLLPDALGDPRDVGGLAMYVRSNVPRLQALMTRIDTGPTIFNLGEVTNPSFDTFAAATTEFNVNFTEADGWVNTNSAAMLCLTSRPQNPTINYFKGPYRFADRILGDLAVPPTTPQTLDAAFGFVATQKIFVQARVTQGDGRLSLPFRESGIGA